MIQTSPGEFVIAGSNVLVRNARFHLGTVDEGRFEKGQWVQGRRLNGDETFSDDFVSLGSDTIDVRKVTTYPVM